MRPRHSLLPPSPAYVWRPGQVLRRLSLRRGRTLVTLPWGARIEVDASESIGGGIARMGIHEPAVSEISWRLADANDLALDVGANIGYFTSMLAHRCARVVALEPHPVILERLRANVGRWPYANIAIEPRAASTAAGVASLGEPAGFEDNPGIASLGLEGTRSRQVETVRLDEVVGESAVGLLKIDVEGHELAALEGLGEALAAGRVRDLLFEEHAPLPSPVSEFLSDHGYELFSLRARLDRVVLGPPGEQAPSWDAPTYLATIEPDRARRRARAIGWRCLLGR
jgi:FkbM family methyltransferase